MHIENQIKINKFESYFCTILKTMEKNLFISAH